MRRLRGIPELHRILILGGAGLLLGLFVQVPQAGACTCDAPDGYVLPMHGSRQVPRNARVFVYLPVAGGGSWFYPTGERVVADYVTAEHVPDAIQLFAGDVQIPMTVESSGTPAGGPGFWWLKPANLLEAGATYQVRRASASATPQLLSEFMTTDEIDDDPPRTLLGVAMADLLYWPNDSSCGGSNALNVLFSYSTPYQDSPYNGVERVFLRRGDGAYDFDAPLVDVPFVLTNGPGYRVGYPIGWGGGCIPGFPMQLDECTQWCVRAHPVDLAGNVQPNSSEACVVLSSLAPYPTLDPNDRMICPGEAGPGVPVPPDAVGGDDVPQDGDDGAGRGDVATCPSASQGGCAAGGAATTAMIPTVLLLSFLLLARLWMNLPVCARIRRGRPRASNP